jgi:hypothetical protein
MQRKAELWVAMQYLEERAVTANMGIGQYVREITDRLMSMDAEK